MFDNDWMKKIAFYSASQFRLGNIIDAGFAASVLFEKYLENELIYNGLEHNITGDFICKAIYHLSEHNSSRYDEIKLHLLRKIRNRAVVHKGEAFLHYNDPDALERIKSDIQQLVVFVWENLDHERFYRYRDINSIPQIHADYAIMEVREYFQDNKNSGHLKPPMISPDDFNDLIHMRKHFLQLSDYLKNGLLKKYKNLEVDLISHVDTTSGYVWLAINHIQPSPDHLIDHIRNSSVSIFATPQHLRICIDFGGEDYQGRQDYYEFLTTDVAGEILMAKSNFSFIDVEWYSFVTAEEPVPQHFTIDVIKERLTSAIHLLDLYKTEGRIVTWDRLLLGYIIPRESISYESIADSVERIVHLYYRFERYRRDVLNRNNFLNWVPTQV